MATSPEEFFADSELGRAVFRRVRELLGTAAGDVEVRTTKSQVAFRRKRGLAYLWLPGRYLRDPAAEVVLSIALPRALDSARFKEVAHPAPNVWMHHLELATPDDVDAEVADWLREAAAAAGA